MIGKVKCVKQQGFGFITPEKGGDDIYFHASSVKDKRFDELKEGVSVEFEVVENARGLCAQEIIFN